MVKFPERGKSMNIKENKAAQSALVIERIFNAPASKVWNALTNKEDIKQWSFEMKEFKAQKGFEFDFYGSKDDVKYLHHCKITDVTPEKNSLIAGGMKAMKAILWLSLNYSLRGIKQG